MKSCTDTTPFEKSDRLLTGLLAWRPTRAVAAVSLGVLSLIVHISPEGSRWLRLIRADSLVAAQEVKQREAMVKVKAVRRIALDAPGYANVMAWAPDSHRLAVGGLLDKRMSVWDVRTGQRLPGPADQMGGTHGLAYSPDGRYLAVARGMIGRGPDQPMPTGPGRYVVSLWDGQSSAWVQNLVDETQEIGSFGVRAIAFSPDARHLAVSYTGGLAFYAREGVSWRRVGALAPNAAQVAFSPDGARLIGTIGNEILVYDVPSGRVLTQWLSLRTGIEVGYPSIAFRPDGLQVAVGEGTRLGFFNAVTGELVQMLEPSKPYTIYGLSFSPNSRYLAMALRRSVHLLDASSRVTVAVLTDHRHSVDRLGVSPDGTIIAAVGGSEITLWELSGLERAER
jgi:WD40 repeat protein